MGWNVLDDLTYDQLVEETHMDEIRENLEFLGLLEVNGTPISSLASGDEIRGPDYDSGWFSVTTSTTYTKAHGLGATPQKVVVWHSAVAAPGASDEIVLAVIVVTAGSVQKGCMGCDATNVYYQSEGSGTDGTVSSTRRSSSAGYIKILAWE